VIISSKRVMTNTFRATIGIMLLSGLLFSSSAPPVAPVNVTTIENKMAEEGHRPSDQFPRPQSVTLQLQKAHPSPTSVATSTASPHGLLPAPPVTAGKAQVMAWIYPGPPGCHAAQEYTDGRSIDTLKPQYFTLADTGVLDLLTVTNSGCNAYSLANARQIKQFSTHQYVTASGTTASMDALIHNHTLETHAMQTLHSGAWTGLCCGLRHCPSADEQRERGGKNP